MSKSLYSLILNDAVVEKIDTVAYTMNTNRSNLINQILADYVSFITPEKKINYIFEHINQLITNTIFSNYSEIVGRNLFLKTSLHYKYKPTIKYCVELYKSDNNTIGELKVLYRLNSEELLYKLSDFFTLIMQIEKKYIPSNVKYIIGEGKFIRTLNIPENVRYSTEEIAKAIIDYISNFDVILKRYLENKILSISQFEYEYKLYLTKSSII